MICLFEMPEISQLWGAKTLEVVGFTQHMASSLTKKKGGFSVPLQSSQDSTYLEPCSATVSLYLHERKKRSSFSPLPFLLTTPNLVNSSFMSCHKTRINTQHYPGMPQEPGTLSFSWTRHFFSFRLSQNIYVKGIYWSSLFKTHSWITESYHLATSLRIIIFMF